jgi:hypothetical protein
VQNWVWSSQTTVFTEDQERSDDQEQQNERDSDTEDALLNFVSLETKALEAIVSVSILGVIELHMVLPQLPELENI